MSVFLVAVMGRLFFAPQNEIMGIILSFMVFAVSYLIRPIGSIFFGHIGDKCGSGVSLKYSMCLMTVPTFFIGILPTYNDIGYLATILLVLLKLIQGFAAGGELPISALYVYERSYKNPNSILLCSLVSAGSMSGVLAASFIVFLLYTILPESSINSWGWRLPFLLGLPLSIIIFYFRKDIYQNNTYINPKSNALPLKKYLKIFIKAIALVSFVQVTFYILFVWMPTYLQYFMGLPYKIARSSNVIALISLAFFTVTFGFISRFINYKKLIIVGSITLICLIYPLMLWMQNANFMQALIIQLIFAFLFGVIEGAYFYTLGQMFKGSNSNTGMAISFTIPNALFSGTAPVICTYFISKFNFTGFPSLYIAILGVLAILALLFIDSPYARI